MKSLSARMPHSWTLFINRTREWFQNAPLSYRISLLETLPDKHFKAHILYGMTGVCAIVLLIIFTFEFPSATITDRIGLVLALIFGLATIGVSIMALRTTSYNMGIWLTMLLGNGAVVARVVYSTEPHTSILYLNLLPVIAAVILPFTKTVALSSLTVIGVLIVPWLIDGAIIPLASKFAVYTAVSQVIIVFSAYEREVADKQRQAAFRSRELLSILNALLSHLGHDIRNPLSVIKMNVDYMDIILKRNFGDELPGKLVHKLRSTEEAVNQIMKILNNVSLLRKLQSDYYSYEVKSFHLQDLLTKIFQQFQSISEANQISLLVEIPEDHNDVSGDFELIVIALAHIVQNAFQHTRAGGRIAVKSSFEGPNWVVQVSDSGNGISEGDLPFIFDHFYRAEAHRPTKVETGGAGLGLTIAEKIIKDHHGSIRVTSTLGIGSMFEICFPRHNVDSSTGATNSRWSHPE